MRNTPIEVDDIVENANNEKFRVTEIEMTYSVDDDQNQPTGYVECTPYNTELENQYFFRLKEKELKKI